MDRVELAVVDGKTEVISFIRFFNKNEFLSNDLSRFLEPKPSNNINITLFGFFLDKISSNIGIVLW